MAPPSIHATCLTNFASYLEEECGHGEGDLPEDEDGGVAPALVALQPLPRRRVPASLQHLDGPLHLVVDQVQLQVDGVGARDLHVQMENLET